MKNYGEELEWELGVDFPEWANTEVYVKTISKGYLLPGEKPKDAYWRVCTTVAKRLGIKTWNLCYLLSTAEALVLESI